MSDVFVPKPSRSLSGLRRVVRPDGQRLPPASGGKLNHRENQAKAGTQLNSQ